MGPLRKRDVPKLKPPAFAVVPACRDLPRTQQKELRPHLQRPGPLAPEAWILDALLESVYAADIAIIEMPIEGEDRRLALAETLLRTLQVPTIKHPAEPLLMAA